MTDTPTLLVELERLLAEATPGPYEARKWGSRYRIIERAQGLTVAHVPVEYMTPAREVADLIVAAVNALPTLVSALRQSQEREAGMREALEAEREWHDLRWDLSMDAAREASGFGSKADERAEMLTASLHRKRIDAIDQALSALSTINEMKEAGK